MPGSPAAPQESRPACQQLLSNRDEVAKHGQALQVAGQKKAPSEELCRLFKAFLAAESKMLKGLEEHSATCGVPPEVLNQVKDGHGKASQMGKRVCELAARPTIMPVPAPECFATKWPRLSCVIAADD
jgi:hypothetical protein